MLFIVSTPIGNLKDITLRALETLKSVDLIACEDTRHTKILTKHYDINTPLTSYYEHNKTQKAPQIIKELQHGKDVALVTDAGTPGISDPGYLLIKLANEHNIPMTVIPGVSAVIAGLTLSGMPAHGFIFEGFLPAKSGARKNKLVSLKEEERTIIFYESPHRLLKTLQLISDVFGEEVTVACAREVTKKFEEVKKGTPKELINHFTSHKPRGEFVVLLSQVIIVKIKDLLMD